MDFESEYSRAAIEAVTPWLYLLPTDVQRKVRLASTVIACHGCTGANELAKVIGGRNWVVAKRTKRIVEKYGDDVICLTPERLQKAERAAIEARVLPDGTYADRAAELLREEVVAA